MSRKRGRHLKSDESPLLRDRAALAALYQEQGKTQSEIAALTGVTQAAVLWWMRRHGIPSRAAVKRDQWGPKHPLWKAGGVGYAAAHTRVERRFGKPKHCSACGTVE